ncbi:CheY-like chemotaxis protein [Spirosoma oryzae]|uniref:CheY-like chemotaxis protein n=1 Tax=Spirosoma oryzae TaxID=1469603 RepID=A0A2T0SUF7_9BACT|nr:response regulator [Spirosoma oryzae]PRY37045.1 CheY-like chemotaxis protein [Spirosoma oryzae]
MPFSPTILLVEANHGLAQTVVQTARRSFGNAIWHTAASLDEAIDCVEKNDRYRLLLVDQKVITGDSSTPPIESFVRHPSLIHTPVLLLSSQLDAARTKWAYEIGFSACHIKPTTTETWDTLLHQMHLYWFTINLVPPTRFRPTPSTTQTT